MKKRDYLKLIGTIFFSILIITNVFVIVKTTLLHSSISSNDFEKFLWYDFFILITGLFLFKYKTIPLNYKLLMLTIFTFLIILEILLMFFPKMFGYEISNMILNKYSEKRNSIYYYDSQLKMQFMKPNYKTLAYLNGYEWLHQTDSKGFRNSREQENSDIILLGDSLIYGHGVNQNQTLAFYLENYTNLAVYNFGRQANSVYEEIYVMNTYGLEQKPKYAFYFFFSNDISDLSSKISSEEMNEFMNTPLENITFPPKPTYHQGVSFSKKITYLFYERPYLYFVYKDVKTELSKIMKKKSVDNKNVLKYQEFSLEWNYTKKAIEQMNEISKQNNIIFVIVPITHFNLNDFTILQNFANEKNIYFINATSMESNKSFYLPHDGHFSEEGHKEMAKIITDFIKDI